MEDDNEEVRKYHREYQRRWYQVPANKSQTMLRAQKWRVGHRLRVRELNAISRSKVKLEVLAHYGPNGEARCSWVECGWKDVRALSIDHVEGGGSRHRKEIGGSGYTMYRWLKKSGFPAGYQTLCMNHQFIKRVENRECAAGKAL
jgi:hypothetical protein